MRTYIFLSITNRCNRSCDYCLVKDTLNKTEDALNKDVLFNYLGYLNKGDLVEITGGEPTLIPWLEELVQFLNNKEVYIVLRTNGYRLFKNVYRWLVVVLNTHDEDAAYAESRESLLRGTDVIISKTVPLDFMDAVSRPKDGTPIVIARGDTDFNHPFGNARMIGHQGHVCKMLCAARLLDSTSYRLGGTIDDYIDVEKAYKPCAPCNFITAPWTWVKRLGLEDTIPENNGVKLNPDKPQDRIIQKRIGITREYADADAYISLNAENESLFENLFRDVKARGFVAEDGDARIGSWIKGLYVIPRGKFAEISKNKDVKLYV